MLAKTLPALALFALLLLLGGCWGEETTTTLHVPEPAPEPEPEPEPGALLRVRVAAGDSFQFKESTTIDTEGSMQGMDIGSQIVIIAAYTYDVVSVDDAGVADVKVTFGRIHGKIQSAMMGEIEFDSEAEGEPDPMSAMAAGQFLARSGASFQVMLDPRGAMSDFRGIDTIVASMAGANPMAAAMQGGEEGIAREFRRQTGEQVLRYPEERALPDVSWNEVTEMALGPVVLALSHDLTLTEEVDDGFSIATKIAMDVPEDEEPDPMAAQMGFEEFSSEGVAVVGKDDGLPVRVDSSTIMRMNPGGQGGMKQVFTRKIERLAGGTE